jgi:hypothetical protein
VEDFLIGEFPKRWRYNTLFSSLIYMTKKEISYLGVVKVMMEKARNEGKNGKAFNQKEVFSNASKRWNTIKNGKDTEYIQGSSTTKRKPANKKRKSKRNKHNHANMELCEKCKLKLCQQCKDLHD